MTFGTVDGGEDDEFLDQQPGDQGGDFFSDDDDFLQQQLGQGDDFTSDDDDDDEDFDKQPDQGELWTAFLKEVIRIRLVSDEEDDDDDEEEENADAPPAAPSEAATVALEADEALADDCCPVCLQDGGEARAADAWPWRRLAPCGHRFHAACVEKWLRVKLTCPVCRCPAAGATADADAAPLEPPRPIVPDIVDEFLAMRFDESLVFEKNPRWMEFMEDDPRNSSGGVPLPGAA